MVVAALVISPFFVWGNPSGHDFEFHMNSWMEVLHQWKQGLVYPAWAALAHHGYGEARFIFYPPVSWTLGAALGAVLPWVAVPGVYVWIALSLAGGSMFWLARLWLKRKDATFAALFYVANPYFLIVIFWRSAFAELLSGALLPLVLLFAWKIADDDKPRRAALWLAVILAAIWLTNIPAAVMTTYSLALFVLVMSIRKRSFLIAGRSLLSLVLGLLMSAFYLLPVLHERSWINLAQVLSPGVRPADNFLFTIIEDGDHNRFNFLVSLIAFSEIVGVIAAILLASRRKIQRSLWTVLALWSATSLLLMSSFSATAWKFAPQLKFVQLPWRWLVCLNCAFAVSAAIAWRRSASRILLYASLLLMVSFVWRRIEPPWWDDATDIAKMYYDQQTGRGYEGTDEYVPAGADGYDVPPGAPLAIGSPPAQIHVEQWNAESKLLSVNTHLPANITLRLLNYPLWKLEINDKPVDSETNEETGQMVVPVPAGLSELRVTLTKGWDRNVGLWISAITVMVVLIVYFLPQRANTLFL